MLRQREERWRGEVTNELRHIDQRLAAVQQSVQELERRLEELFARHLEYHSANEHRWGLMRWAQRYPLRFAALVAAGAVWVLRADAAVWPLVRDLLVHVGR